METISQVRETLTRSLENAKEQLKASREAKHQERKPLAEIAPVLSSSFPRISLLVKSNRKSNFCPEKRPARCVSCLAGNGLERQGAVSPSDVVFFALRTIFIHLKYVSVLGPPPGLAERGPEELEGQHHVQVGLRRLQGKVSGYRFPSVW